MPSIADVARQELERADNDVVRATDAMAAMVSRKPSLFRALMTPLVRQACYNAITSQCRKGRHVIWQTPQPSLAEQKCRVGSLAQATIATLMDFPLPGGLRLRHATRDDVSDAATFYREQSKDMGVKARWLRMIEQAMPERGTVGDVMTDDRLVSLKEKAEKAND